LEFTWKITFSLSLFLFLFILSAFYFLSLFSFFNSFHFFLALHSFCLFFFSFFNSYSFSFSASSLSFYLFLSISSSLLYFLFFFSLSVQFFFVSNFSFVYFSLLLSFSFSTDLHFYSWKSLKVVQGLWSCRNENFGQECSDLNGSHFQCVTNVQGVQIRAEAKILVIYNSFPACPQLWRNFLVAFLVGHELKLLSHSHLIHNWLGRPKWLIPISSHVAHSLFIYSWLRIRPLLTVQKKYVPLTLDDRNSIWYITPKASSWLQ